MSRKGNCLDNAATEQVFGHLKDEFYRGREFDSYEQFKSELDAYIIHWNPKRTPDTTRGTHPGGIPDHVPRSLERYPNKQRPTNGAQFNNGGVAACVRAMGDGTGSVVGFRGLLAGPRWSRCGGRRTLVITMS